MDTTSSDFTPFPVLEEHGPTELPDAPISRRTLKSAVWGGAPIRITTENSMDVTSWNPDCSWYQYGKQLCLNGCQHPGMDIGLSRGTALFAAEGGTVAFAGKARAYRPHYVAIQSDSGSLQIYGHLWSVDPAVVTDGRVSAGQYLGDSGEQTKPDTMIPDGSGPHLHFEVRKDGCSINPEPILVGAVASKLNAAAQFDPGDALSVAEGPLQLRTNAGTAADIIRALAVGTKSVVLDGPVESGEHNWYEVQVIGSSGRGWVAGTFCERIDI